MGCRSPSLNRLSFRVLRFSLVVATAVAVVMMEDMGLGHIQGTEVHIRRPEVMVLRAAVWVMGTLMLGGIDMCSCFL